MNRNARIKRLRLLSLKRINKMAQESAEEPILLIAPMAQPDYEGQDSDSWSTGHIFVTVEPGISKLPMPSEKFKPIEIDSPNEETKKIWENAGVIFDTNLGSDFIQRVNQIEELNRLYREGGSGLVNWEEFYGPYSEWINKINELKVLPEELPVSKHEEQPSEHRSPLGAPLEDVYVAPHEKNKDYCEQYPDDKDCMERARLNKESRVNKLRRLSSLKRINKIAQESIPRVPGPIDYKELAKAITKEELCKGQSSGDSAEGIYCFIKSKTNLKNPLDIITAALSLLFLSNDFSNDCDPTGWIGEQIYVWYLQIKNNKCTDILPPKELEEEDRPTRYFRNHLQHEGVGVSKNRCPKCKEDKLV